MIYNKIFLLYKKKLAMFISIFHPIFLLLQRLSKNPVITFISTMLSILFKQLQSEFFKKIMDQEGREDPCARTPTPDRIRFHAS